MDLASNLNVEAMSNNDFFLSNGCSVTDEAHQFDFVMGNYNMFAFDHQKILFTKVEY